MLVKNSLAAFAISLTILGGQANAGGMASPLMEPEVIVEESTASSGGFLIPLLLLALLVAISQESTPPPVL